MRQIFKLPLALLAAAFLLISFTDFSEKANYKCMIQLKNYTGEGAYVVVSIIDNNGEYDQTLYVQGKDSEWYSEITEWWQFYGKRRPDIDAISGATVSGGERTISVLNIPVDKMDKGYRIRFETAVEDQEYHTSDIEFELTTENLKGKKDGSGFIRYVRLMPQS
ncbi:DUF2271 domain-containing protein [Nonlabens ulvanivorans]|uniref:DUF2271 domain-containing protein n=1 Tax=Nonlabens ulvanivorans TaxID=906888 RepID=UPI002941E838|nr:DUF2271 domain-containing protein [Nonlabens ulvanivorans]WOI21812.1 DUF2271 domain-containing protein [Nonlabens ulvanivorans]